jgi:hypothetical protein
MGIGNYIFGYINLEKMKSKKKFVATFYYAEDMAEPMTTQLISVLMYNLDL